MASLTKHSSTLIKLSLRGAGRHRRHNIPLSYITKFTHLQELALSLVFHDDRCTRRGAPIDVSTFKVFKTLEYATFPQLQIVKFQRSRYPSEESSIKFLE